MSSPADFTYGLWDCMGDMGVCIHGCFCLPCLMCENQARVEGEECGCKQCCFPMLEFNTRQFIRRRKHMRDECCYDCCVFWACAPCVICQDARELKEGFGYPPSDEYYYGKGHEKPAAPVEPVKPMEPAQPLQPVAGYPQQPYAQPGYAPPPPGYAQPAPQPYAANQPAPVPPGYAAPPPPPPY